jgi:Bacterial SH3 domain
MKICAYCTTENRDQAIFCRHCRRPLRATPTRKDHSSRTIPLWLLVVFVLIGLSSYLFSSRSFLASTATATLIPTDQLTPEPPPTRIKEPVVISACVSDTARIRRGPGTQYETIGGLVSGTCLTILGRSADANWVSMVSEDHQTGWVAASLLPNAGDLSRVSVRDDSAMVNSARPTLTSAEIAFGAQAYLTKVSATNMPQSSLTRYVVPCFEAANRIGEYVSCRVERAYCDYLPLLEGSPTFCNDRPYPDQSFALIVLGADWSDYEGQCLIVSGYLQIDRGVLEIQADNRSQVSYCK